MIKENRELERGAVRGLGHPERREGERSEPEQLGGGPNGVASPENGIPGPEVPEKARRRRFSAEYKNRILAEADACSEAGEVGALLRREGLYSSHLSAWRRQREQGGLAALGKKRGRKPLRDERQQELERLQRENRQLRRKLEQAELVLEIQKKASEILGIPLNPRADDGSDS